MTGSLRRSRLRRSFHAQIDVCVQVHRPGAEHVDAHVDADLGRVRGPALPSFGAVVLRSPPSPLACHVHDQAMAHTLIDRPAGEVAVQSGAVVSKVVHHGDGLNVTVFASTPVSSSPNTKQPALTSSRSSPDGLASSSTAKSSTWPAGPGCTWRRAHLRSLVATEPTVMLLTLFGS